LRTLRDKEEAKQAQEEELSRYKDSDPRAIAEKSLFSLYAGSNIARLVTLYKEAANLATDNIWILQCYFTRQMGIDREDVNSRFGIDEDAFDEVV
jgi:Leucine zipper with capping helix domain